MTEASAVEHFNSEMPLNNSNGENITSIQKSWIVRDGGNYIMGGYEIQYIRAFSNGQFKITAIVDSAGRTTFLRFQSEQIENTTEGGRRE